MPDTGLDHKAGMGPAAARSEPERLAVSPRGRTRCRALLDAAAALFVERGFAATSLSDVLRQAGGSRTTLYTHFGDKDGLFRAMMEEHCARVLDEMAPDQTTDKTDDPEERLTRIGLHIARSLMAPETTAILRTLISEGARIPDLVQTFVRVGPERTQERLAGCFRDLAAAGHIQIADPRAAAQAFSGMVTGNLLLEQLVLPDRPVARVPVDSYVRACVRLFLRGAAPPPA